tara:strand:+ start:1103 stop:1297 length:195 start_codon:yes stop_codon:yes gene_type:complete
VRHHQGGPPLGTLRAPRVERGVPYGTLTTVSKKFAKKSYPHKNKRILEVAKKFDLDLALWFPSL